MSLSGENMDTDPASKICHSGHKETKANSPIHQERPASSGPSCVSIKSVQSMGPPETFREEPYSPIHQERPASSGPSCVSMKSVRSMEVPTHFREEPYSPIHQERPASSIPSCNVLVWGVHREEDTC
ncbi:hypothetical protein UPYG_G00095370 [Umbra pygmaea]|uniref:Uncharacterized protein n=1 Tax=Umbra pygmaea TaxID=75934 RepID=A0ABD0XMC5_UMBPY